EPRTDACAAVLGTTAYVFGGTRYVSGQIQNGAYPDVSDRELNDVWKTTDGTTWTLATASAAQTARSEAAMVAHGGKLWILGGEDMYLSGYEYDYFGHQMIQRPVY